MKMWQGFDSFLTVEEDISVKVTTYKLKNQTKRYFGNWEFSWQSLKNLRILIVC